MLAENTGESSTVIICKIFKDWPGEAPWSVYWATHPKSCPGRVFNKTLLLCQPVNSNIIISEQLCLPTSIIADCFIETYTFIYFS